MLFLLPLLVLGTTTTVEFVVRPMLVERLLRDLQRDQYGRFRDPPGWLDRKIERVSEHRERREEARDEASLGPGESFLSGDIKFRSGVSTSPDHFSEDSIVTEISPGVWKGVERPLSAFESRHRFFERQRENLEDRGKSTDRVDRRIRRYDRVFGKKN